MRGGEVRANDGGVSGAREDNSGKMIGHEEEKEIACEGGSMRSGRSDGKETIGRASKRRRGKWERGIR